MFFFNPLMVYLSEVTQCRNKEQRDLSAQLRTCFLSTINYLPAAGHAAHRIYLMLSFIELLL